MTKASRTWWPTEGSRAKIRVGRRPRPQPGESLWIFASSRCFGANRQLIALFLPTADHSVIVASGRQRTAPLTVGSAGRRRPVGPWALRAPARVTSVGNRPRPHHGGTHARRIHGTPTCQRAPPRRPTSPVYLPGPGPPR